MKTTYMRPSIPWSSIPTFQKVALTVTWTATAVWLSSMAYAGWQEVIEEKNARRRLETRHMTPDED